MFVVACPSFPATKYAMKTVRSWTKNARVATSLDRSTKAVRSRDERGSGIPADAACSDGKSESSEPVLNIQQYLRTKLERRRIGDSTRSEGCAASRLYTE